ncbi:MAG: DUF3373 family protein [Deltaproteobacteria bacterium]|nr:DUF3373 family protein [Deltaproteobacteria bacterium]
MKRTRTILAGLAVAGLLLPCASKAEDATLQQKIDALSQEVEALKRQASTAGAKGPSKSLDSWLTIGGDYRFRVDSLRGRTADHFAFQDALGFMLGGPAPTLKESDTVKNNLLYTNRFGLNLKAKVTQNVSLTSRLLFYKTFGNSDTEATTGPFFADRVGTFDGTQGHVPGDGKLLVDQVYATWSNILDQPLWLSVGRRPSTGGIPSHLRQNAETPGNAGIPALLVDYAFDGMTLGYAPDIEKLPGAYGKICYGRAFENGFTGGPFNKGAVKDTDMLGISVVPIDTDPLYVDLQWNRGFHIFDFPVMERTALDPPFDSTRPRTDLGSIDWYGLTVLSSLKKIGPGTLNWFASAALSVTHPNDNTVQVPDPTNPLAPPIDTGAGLLYTGERDSKTGWGFYAGARYDYARTRTKLGLEYNHGSKNWITFVPASDDLWTGKLGTRGNVYEAYLIQELNQKPIASFISKAFFRLGYQLYDFEWTGSNNWVGAPIKISDLDQSPANAQMLTPIKRAQDLYATFEVRF